MSDEQQTSGPSRLRGGPAPMTPRGGTGPSEARLDVSGAARPSTCRIVRYVGKIGYNAVRAAIVTCDVDTLDPRGVAAGDIPALDSPMHVHLWVFTPGESGGFTEYNVPYGDGPGMWSWPPRV